VIVTLSIKNYALIEDIRVTFNEGWTIITGETGAGKSILLGALSLVLGNRADPKVVRHANKKCVIEAEFLIDQYNLKTIFKRNDLDYEPQTILRREILPSGKSRAFVNDTPVTLQQLHHLKQKLIDVHSQNDTQTLATEDYQIHIIDTIAGNTSLLKQYSEKLTVYKQAVSALVLLQEQRTNASKELDYHSFLYKELQEIQLTQINQKELEQAYEKLNNTEEIGETFTAINQLIGDDVTGSIATLIESRNVLGRIQEFSLEYKQEWLRLNSLIIELEDIFEELKKLAEGIAPNPQELASVNAVLQSIYKLQQKHGVNTVEELLELEKELEQKISFSLDIDHQIEEAHLVVETTKQELEREAVAITNKREKAIPKLKEQLEKILKNLGLPNAQFEFLLHKSDAFRKNGKDVLEFLFTANKGTHLGALDKVASGGEMSRIMLAVKSILAQYGSLPTLIFDEIDTGVSGEIAHKMAEIMAEMSKNMQILSITHLPQIAAKGTYHKKVYKEDLKGVTNTHIKELSKQDRVVEIAQMIGGSTISDSALAHAQQLLN